MTNELRKGATDATRDLSIEWTFTAQVVGTQKIHEHLGNKYTTPRNFTVGTAHSPLADFGLKFLEGGSCLSETGIQHARCSNLIVGA